jgi:hypothetical protein
MSIQLPPVRIQFIPTGTTAASGPATGQAPGFQPAGPWSEGMSVSDRSIARSPSSGTVGADLFRRAFADDALGKVLENCLKNLDDVA